MPKLNVQQNNQNVIQAFRNALAIGNLKGIIASDGNHNFSTAGSNRNLLDNPWFTVNQRGQSSYTGRVYGVDRWIEYGTGNTVTVTNNGITLPIDQNSGFEQYFDDTFIQGKTVTISFMTADGTVTSKTVTWPTSGANITAYSNGVAFFYGTVVGKKGLAILTNAEVTLRAVKLELGSVSTLANDAPPDYGTELAKCMRYFQRLSGYLSYIGSGYCDDTTNAYFLCPLSVPLRSGVTVSLSYSGVYLNSNSIQAVTGLSVLRNPTSYNASGIALKATASGLTSKATALLQFRAENGYIDLSADL